MEIGYHGSEAGARRFDEVAKRLIQPPQKRQVITIAFIAKAFVSPTRVGRARRIDAASEFWRPCATCCHGALITTDVGWNQKALAQCPVYTRQHSDAGASRRWAYGAPAAQVPGRVSGKVVVALVGDGGFGQNPASWQRF